MLDHRLTTPWSSVLPALLLGACGNNGGLTNTGLVSMATGDAASTDAPVTPTTGTTGTTAPDTPTSTGTTDATTGTSTGTTLPPATSTGDTSTGTSTSDTSSSSSSTTGDDTTTGGDDSGKIPGNCPQAALARSTVGCLFYAVDMDSHDLAEGGQYSVAVANVQPFPATVTIERKQGAAWSVIAGPTEVAALDLARFDLPDQHTDDSQLAAGFAYRVTADVPVIAYQFNPVDGQQSFLSDAAMLYPVAAWDHINHAITFTASVDASRTDQRSYASAVAHADGTEITVTPKVATRAGPGVPAGQPGVPFTVTLAAGDVLSVAVDEIGASLSGTRFESAEATPFALFAGLECAQIPTDVCCCDHLEEQLAGVRLWGKEFIAARVPVRDPGQPEPSLWQLYGAEDDTTVTLTAAPQVTGLPANPIKLGKGQVVEFYAGGPPAEPGDFEIFADKPIAVMNYMTSAGVMPAPYDKLGDPLSVQIPAVEQYLPRYVVLVPSSWDADFGVFTREAGATITIDGVPIADAAFHPVGAGSLEVGRVPLPDGVHLLEGGGSLFSVIVVGFDMHDSYGYLGGTGTRIINPDPQ